MRLKKLTAALTSVIMLASAAAIPAGYTGYAATGTVFSSTFDSGISDWGMYKESGGSGKLSAQDGKLALTVDSVGKVTYALQMYYDIIPLYQNGVYRLSFEISSTQDRFIEAMIQQNGGTYQAYTWKGINVTSTPTKVNYEFTMEEETDIMAKMVFNCGVHEKEDNGVTSFPTHTIYLDNVSLELVDDSKVDYAASRPYEPDINVNQIGYKTNSPKTAVIRVSNEDDIIVSKEFTVVNADTNKVVYTGSISDAITNSSADEDNYIADFSAIHTPGRYYVKSQGLDDSYTFEIGDNIYQNLLDDTVRMMYLQRCGTAVTDTKFSHKACHSTKAKIYGSNEYIDVSGGWHDAGDYGRYVVPAAKTVADMLNAYGANPGLFSDNIGIPESGNGVPDVLDEVKYALDWMFKMQDSSGGVHHKVTCENFPGFVMPEEETEELIVTPITTTATADFCGSMALAYKYFKDVDASFANKCLDAAKKAYVYLEAHPDFSCYNPEDITTGDYKDQSSSDKDERYWAAAQMYTATKDENYLSGLSVRTGMGWSSVGDYGSIAIVTAEGIDKNSDVYKNAANSIISQADKYVKTTNASPYGSPITKYNWGSNMDVANSGIVTALAAELTGDSSYIYTASENLNYLLGKNPNGTCYVTGYGTVSPEHPHHRPSIALDTPMPGMLVGGVDSFLEDSAAKAYLRDYAPAKRWVDNDQSYSTNEVTTYWNSPLIYLLAVTDTAVVNNTNIKGDVNCDGIVNYLDVSQLQKYIVNKINLTAEQAYNADVNSDGRVDAMDVTALRRSLTRGSDVQPPAVTTTLPTTQPSVTTTTTTTIKAGMDTTADVIADFRQGKSQYFFASDGWTNGSCFDCGWFEKNTSFDGGVLNLTIDKDYSGKYNYSGAEYRTYDYYGYGYYETSMQAIKNDGVVSSFFTYTGPSDNNPWDEIDIEVLGKDTTQVQFNYYTSGVGDHEFMYDLGFDASQGFHRYGFDWQPDHITWYIDGKAVYTAYDNIPTTPGKIMMNVWPGITVDDWLKPFNGNTPLTAKYEWVTYKK